MAAFHFRLETNLNLAEQVLEDFERQLALELEKEVKCLQKRQAAEALWLQALKGQKEAGCLRPDELGTWQAYARYCYEALKVAERQLKMQQELVAKTREDVIRANREVEKLKRLKTKKWTAFLAGEQKKEQKSLDEVGQVIFMLRNCGVSV